MGRIVCYPSGGYRRQFGKNTIRDFVTPRSFEGYVQALVDGSPFDTDLECEYTTHLLWILLILFDTPEQHQMMFDALMEALGDNHEKKEVIGKVFVLFEKIDIWVDDCSRAGPKNFINIRLSGFDVDEWGNCSCNKVLYFERLPETMIGELVENINKRNKSLSLASHLFNILSNGPGGASFVI
jgi:hypothetical protein